MLLTDLPHKCKFIVVCILEEYFSPNFIKGPISRTKYNSLKCCNMHSHFSLN